ncbi:unnamed protein product [Mytilus coruscus]|nr:unnamed protein product [Mytilus coruscus]
MTAHPSTTEIVTSTIMKFDDVEFSVGITNLSSYRNTGKFTCEQEGLCIISAFVMSSTTGARYYIILNGNYFSETYIGGDSGNRHHIGAATITWNLNPKDQVWLYASGTFSLTRGLYSKLTIIKIK